MKFFAINLAISLLISTASFASSPSSPGKSPSTFTVRIGNFKKDYSYVQPKGSPVKISFLDFRNDAELINATAAALADQMVNDAELLIVLGDQANILGAKITETLKVTKKKNIPWMIINGKESPHGSFATVKYSSITSGNKTMHLSNHLVNQIKGKKVVIFDDVISTGGTMRAAIELIKKAGGEIRAIMCGFTEEKQRSDFEGYNLIKLGHLEVVPSDR